MTSNVALNPLSSDSPVVPSTNYVFSDKYCYDNLMKHFLMWVDITNFDPMNKKTFAHSAFCLYEAATIMEENPLKASYRFQGNESPDVVALRSMYNALLVFGPLTPGSNYEVCRCGRVIHKSKHYNLKNPNADCCVYCVNTYDEDQYSANKLFDMPTSLCTNDVFDLEEPIPACPQAVNDPND